MKRFLNHGRRFFRLASAFRFSIEFVFLNTVDLEGKVKKRLADLEKLRIFAVA